MQKKLSNELVDQYIRVGTGPALHSDQQEIKQTLVTNPQLRIQILSPSRILVAKQTLQTVKKDRRLPLSTATSRTTSNCWHLIYILWLAPVSPFADGDIGREQLSAGAAEAGTVAARWSRVVRAMPLSWRLLRGSCHAFHPGTV